MNCPECGASNAASTRYCTRCGTPLGASNPAGQKRKTTADAGVFGGPSGGAPVPPPPRRPASGAVRRTVLEGAASSSVPAPPPMPGSAAARRPPPPPPRPSAPAPRGGRSRTVLDEGPAPAAPAAQGGARPQVAGGARIIGWMVSFDHNGSGQDYVIRAGKTRIGRARDNEISVFFESKASDLHCTIIWRGGKAAVKDEGSTNGTLVNGEDIGIAGVEPLSSGDTLTIGGSTFQVFLINPEFAGQTWPQSGWAKG